jgi:hypothetical protein
METENEVGKKIKRRLETHERNKKMKTENTEETKHETNKWGVFAI